MYYILAFIFMVIVAMGCLLTEVVDTHKKPAEKGFLSNLVVFFEKPAISFCGLLFLFSIFLASRLFHLGIAPTGLHVDEMGMAYDAVCLSGEGMDRWGHVHPVYLDNFHTGQSLLYAYLTSVLLKFLPISKFIIRLPAAIVASLSFFSMFVIGKIVTGKKIGGLIADSLMIVTPYFLMSERWALDCNLFLSMSVVSLAFVLLALEKRKWYLYLLSGLSLGITLYTYILSYLVIPLFVLCILIWMIVRRKKSQSGAFKDVIKDMLILIIPIVLLGIPLLLEQLVNMGIVKPFSLLGSDYFMFSTERSEEFVPSNFFANIGMLSKQLFTNDELAYNAIPQFGAILKPMIPLALYGLYLTVKRLIKERRDCDFAIAAFALCGYLILLFMKAPNFNRYNELFLSILIFNLVALWEMINGTKWAQIFGIFSILAVCVCFAFFAKYYYCDMNDEYNPHLLFSSVEYADALKVADDLYNPDKSKKVYVEIEYDMLSCDDLMLAAYSGAKSADWRAFINGETGDSLGRIVTHFPEEFDENEEAVYVLGVSWNHISDYLISIGFNEDRRFENYRILYR